MPEFDTRTYTKSKRARRFITKQRKDRTVAQGRMDTKWRWFMPLWPVILGLILGFIGLICLAMYENKLNKAQGKPGLDDIGIALEFAKYEHKLDKYQRRREREYEALKRSTRG